MLAKYGSNEPWLLYLASITEIDALLREQFSNLFLEIPNSTGLLPMKNAGCLGADNCRISFVNMETTSDIVGLSSGFS